VEVIVNEVEPLKKLQRLIISLAWRPIFLVKADIVYYLMRKELSQLKEDFARHAVPGTSLPKTSEPYLLHGATRKIGVVLIHSYLARPEQVRQVANHLSRKGIWVYVPRLAGHGTTPEDLAERKYEEWLDSVEAGYAVISNICQNVVVGGVAAGGSLALDLAVRVKKISGVFAICPPYSLDDFSTMFMPTVDVWNRILGKFHRNALEDRFLELSPDTLSMSYSRSPVFGVMEVDRLLGDLRHKLDKVTTPALIIQTSDNPVVAPEGSRHVFDKLGSKSKRFCLVESKRHIIVKGEGSEKVQRLIEGFIRDLCAGT
jgi:esterase/lipase